jgi:hypothetical protein
MKFIKLLFSSEGGASFSRVCSFCNLISATIWATHLVFRNHTLPEFTGLIAWICGPYTIGKAADLYVKVKNGKNGANNSADGSVIAK